MFIAPDKLQVFEDTADIGTVDWVVVALKSSSLEAISDLIYPLLRPNTRVLNIMNGLIEEDMLSSLAKRDGKDDASELTCCAAVYGGMALLCSNRIGPGHIDHSYAGLLSGGVAQAASVNPEEDRQAFEALWEPAKVDIAYEP